MPQIVFQLADGSRINADGRDGESLMRVAVRHNIEAIIAECGGCCSCATCHVHIAREWFDKLPPIEEAERDMLEFAEGADATSRLSCQIPVSDKLHGLLVHVPASQY